jgi:hypothetical protein
VAVLAASGCVNAGLLPMASAQVSGGTGRLEPDGVGMEVSGVVDEFCRLGDLHGRVTSLPMREGGAGEQVEVNAADLMLVGRIPIVPAWDPWLHARLGGGYSLAYIDRRYSPDFGGMGLCGTAGIGIGLTENSSLDVFGNAHGWLGSDGNEGRSAYAVSLGASLSVRF